MKILKKSFAGNEVLQVTPINPSSGIDFLNWRVSIRKGCDRANLKGPGLYGVFYRGKLIYIGKFLGTRTNPFSGNIVVKRWWTHFASLTMRGHRLSFPKTTLTNLLEGTLTALDPGIRDALTKAAQTLSKDRGCVTSMNRALFSNQNWTTFNCAEPQALLRSFSFIYVRIAPSALADTVDALRERISYAEKIVIARLQPIANKEIRWNGMPRNVSDEAAATFMVRTLRNATPNSPSIPT